MDSNSIIKGNELGPMTALSVLFHLAVMVLILFVPDSLPGGERDGVVYEVSLVEMPSSDNRVLPIPSTRVRFSWRLDDTDTRYFPCCNMLIIETVISSAIDICQ